MKKLFLLGILVPMLVLVSCEKEQNTQEENQKQQYTVGVNDVDEFDQVIKEYENKYPVNKLSEKSINHLRESLIFDESSLLVSLNYSIIEEKKELTKDELTDLINLLLFEEKPQNENNKAVNVPEGFAFNVKPDGSGVQGNCAFSFHDICRMLITRRPGGGSNG